MADKQTLQQRLKQTEESLRNEVLQAEEQRAYIEMLKDQVDQKIKAVGLSFEAEPTNNAAVNMSRSNDLSRNGMQQQPSGGVRSNSNSRHSVVSGNSGLNSQQNRSRQSLSKSNSQ